MNRNRVGRAIALAMAITVIGSVLLAPAALGGTVTRTKGTGSHFYVSWTEIDLDNTLGLPGNVHVGFLGGWNDQFGTYLHGIVTDWECPPGVLPHGGGHDVNETVVEEAVLVAELAVDKAIGDLVDAGATVVNAGQVIDTVGAELADEVLETIEEEIPSCAYVQDRFLEGPNATFSVDMTAKAVTVSGSLVVTGGHGGHGEPGPVLGQPPVNITITGGDWWNYDHASKWWNAAYKYNDWRKGTDYYGGVVTGAIGAMGFADDADDEAFGGFGAFEFKTVERIRN